MYHYLWNYTYNGEVYSFTITAGSYEEARERLECMKKAWLVMATPCSQPACGL